MNDITKRNLNNPVWNVYDLLRTAKLNVLYYTQKLICADRIQIFMQIVLAAAVPSSAIAGFKIWDFGLGRYAWVIFVSFSSLVAFMKPFLGLSKKSKKYSEIIDGYKILFYDLQDIQQKVEEDKLYSLSHKNLFKYAKDRRKVLEVKETGINLNKHLRSKCQEAVKKEFPARKFYIPKED